MNSVRMPSEQGLSYKVDYEDLISAKHIWETRRLLQASLGGTIRDWRLRRLPGPACASQGAAASCPVVLTTTTFLDAMLLTLAVDRIQQAKAQKCARSDCGIVFTVVSGHEKKYCERYCAHIESGRRDRRRKKKSPNVGVRRVHSGEGRRAQLVTITQRYVHPQADAVQRAFIAFGNLGIAEEPKSLGVGTILGTVENCESGNALQVIGAKGGTRTPTGFPARS